MRLQLVREDLDRLITPVMNSHVRSAQRMTYGDQNLVFIIQLDDGREVVFRATEDKQVYPGTVRTLKVLRELNLPVPQVLHMDRGNETTFAWMLLEAFPGRDLRFELPHMTRAEMTLLAQKIVGFQRNVGKLSFGSGFGWVALGDRGPFSSWLEIIQRDLSDGSSAAHRSGRPELASRVKKLVADLSTLLERQAPVPFLDDVTTKNVIVQNGTLQGLIDFDWICYGDPLYQLALTSVCVVSDVGESGEFYIEELTRIWAIGDEDTRKLALYKALHGLDFLGKLSANPDRASAGRISNAIGHWLAKAGA